MDIYKVREVRAEELPRLAEIERECIHEPRSVKAFEAEFAAKGAVFLAAENENGEICGFVTASSVLDEVNVNNVAVTASCRRKGIATLLMNALWDKVKGFAAFVTLEVRESNAPAAALYEKLGYKKVGVRKNFYSNPCENAVLMTKYKE